MEGVNETDRRKRSAGKDKSFQSGVINDLIHRSHGKGSTGKSFLLDLGLDLRLKLHQTRLGILNLDVLALLDDQLVKLLVGLIPLVILGLSLLASVGSNHDDGSRALGAASGTQLGARRQENVRDVVVLAEDGDVGDDVHGADVGGEDDNGGSSDLGGGRVGGGGFTDGLDDFFDTALEALLLCGCDGC